jgi:hypothetical protein
MDLTAQSRKPQVPDQSTLKQEANECYNPPSFVTVGKSASLTHQNINGHLKDGSGGWWVWGS